MGPMIAEKLNSNQQDNVRLLIRETATQVSHV